MPNVIRFCAMSGPYDSPSDGDSLVLWTTPQKAREHAARVYSNYQEYARIARVEIQVLASDAPVPPQREIL